MKLIGNIEMPFILEIQTGEFKVTNAMMQFNRNPEELISGFTLVIDITTSVMINGSDIVFDNQIQHTYTEKEFLQFIDNLKTKEL